jgi:hypothetical protein
MSGGAAWHVLEAEPVTGAGYLPALRLRRGPPKSS